MDPSFNGRTEALQASNGGSIPSGSTNSMHKYLKMAHLNASRGNKHRRAFVGAVGIRADGTVVISWNGSSAGTTYERCPTAHAERRLCRKLGYGASVVYVARSRRENGSMAMSRPCADCERVLRSRGVKRVEYTISDNEFGVMEF